jgi:hypothetical protein
VGVVVVLSSACMMMIRLTMLLLVVLVVVVVTSLAQQQAGQVPLEPFKRFEYKYSFKPPYLAQKDGSVPFFEYSGSE